MILLNFSHPLTGDQLAQVQELTGQPLTRVVEMPVQFDNNQPFLPQFSNLMARLDVPARELQSEAVAVYLPALNFIAGLVLAELHGRMGYFPPVLRLRPIPGSLPPRFEVAEVLNLQAVRDAARATRYG